MFGNLLHGYRRSLAWTLDHPALIMIVFVATLGLNVLLLSVIPKGFFPQQDTGVINGGMQGQQDASFALDAQRPQAVGRCRQIRSQRAEHHGFHRRRRRHQHRE